METGIKGMQTIVVTEALTAEAMGSGAEPVFATPQMIALMENTCLESVQPLLEEGFSTVGTMVNVTHVSATPVGMRVTCETELIEVDDRKLTFAVKAYDEAGLIGEGTHGRAIIHKKRFRARAKAKLTEAAADHS
ncbi:MAG: thioesterase family protein [Lachnospiraceae bacterium]|nr:thioesterase family protein [Lachnospiraceae bacterium]